MVTGGQINSKGSFYTDTHLFDFWFPASYTGRAQSFKLKSGSFPINIHVPTNKRSSILIANVWLKSRREVVTFLLQYRVHTTWQQ